jgi:hypothetical protein
MHTSDQTSILIQHHQQTSINPTLSSLQTILPNDIIGSILFGGYLDSNPRQTAVIRSVCSQFTSLASTCCKTLDAKPNFGSEKKKKLSIRSLSSIIWQFPSLTEVDFSHLGDAFTDSHFRLLSPLRTQLRALKLRGTAVGDEGVLQFLGFSDSTKSPNLPLEILDLSKTFLLHSNKIGILSMVAVGVRIISEANRTCS